MLTQAFWGLGMSYCKCKVFVNNLSVLSRKRSCLTLFECVTELHLLRPGFARALKGGTAPSLCCSGASTHGVVWVVPALLRESRLSREFSRVETQTF